MPSADLAVGPLAAGAARCPLLIGRDEQSAAVRRCVDRAALRQGSVVVVAGEAGIGKSRLLKDVLSADGTRSLRQMVGRGVASATRTPYRPLAEAVLTALRASGPPPDEELRPFAAVLAQLVPEWGEHSRPLEQSPLLVGEALLRLLSLEGAAHVLVLEDLHWFDEDSLAVVEYVADNVQQLPVAVLATVRDDEPSAALHLVHELVARRSAGIVPLRRLGAGATADMVRGCLGAQVAPEVAARTHRWAEGNPFLVEELLAAWVGSGVVRQVGGTWQAEQELLPVVPVTFTGTVRRRLEVLPPDQARVLQAAALLGREVEPTVLPEAVGQSLEAVLEALRAGTRVELLEQPPVRSRQALRFRHALTVDAVADTLLPGERALLAGRLLRALERRYPGLPGSWCETAAELAAVAEEPARHVDLLLTCGRRALRRGALAGAEVMFRRAQVVGPATPLEVEDCLTEVLVLAGNTGEAEAAGERLLAQLDRASAPAGRRIEVHLRLARCALTATEWSTAERHVTAARELAQDDDPAATAQVAAVEAHLALGRGDGEHAVGLASAALPVAQQLHLADVACEALEVLGRVARDRDPGAARGLFERALALAERHELGAWRLRALLELATLDLDDLTPAASQRLLVARELLEHSGAVFAVAQIDNLIAVHHLLRGEAAAAVTAARRCADAARRYRLGLLLPMALTAEAEAHALTGQARLVEAATEQALVLGGQHRDVVLGVAQARGVLALVRNDRRGALEQLDVGMRALRSAGGGGGAWALPGLWALLQVLEVRDASAVDVVEVQGLAGYRVTDFLLACGRAVAAGQAGDGPAAEALLARALRDAQDLEWWRALAQRLVAESAVAQGWARPAEELAAAHDWFQEHEFPVLASACRALQRRAGVPARRRGRGDAAVPPDLDRLGVTSREMDVLVLLVEGCSTAEVAQRLYLSPRTVQNHVDRLLQRTGQGSRARLVAFAAPLTSGR